MRSTRWLRISRSDVGRRSSLRYDGSVPWTGRVDPLDRRRAVWANARGSDPDRSRLDWRDDLRRPSGRAHERDSRRAIRRGLRLWVAAGAGCSARGCGPCTVGWIAWWGVSACGERVAIRLTCALTTSSTSGVSKRSSLGVSCGFAPRCVGPAMPGSSGRSHPNPTACCSFSVPCFARAAYSVGSIGTRSHRFIGSFSGGLTLGIEQHIAKALTGSVERAGRSSARRDSWLVEVAWSAHDRTRWSCGGGRSR